MSNRNKIICTYISKEWIGDLSYRSFANKHNIDENTVRKITKLSEGKIDNFKIQVITLLEICEAREITLSDFFAQVGL